jgi:Fic family protein
MLFQTPSLSERETEVVGEIETIRRQLNLPRLQQWPGLTWRAINDRLLRMSARVGGGNALFEDAIEAAEEEPSAESAAIWSAASGYRAALTFALHLADASHFTYDEGIFRALHYMITSHDAEKKPGRWRRGAIWVRKGSPGEILYTAPPPKLIPSLLAELIASLNERNESPAIIRAAMAHLNLAAIHPFLDGNGRMSRALHTLVLAREGITAPPFASIDEYMSVNVGEYDKALTEVHGGAWQPERDTRPWIRFCLTAHFYQATMLQRRSREYDRLWEAIEREVARRGLPERAIFALAEAAIGRRFTSAEYQSAAGVSADEADGDLKGLVDAGLLVAATEKDGRVYLASDAVKAIWARTRDAGEPNVDPFATNNRR